MISDFIRIIDKDATYDDYFGALDVAYLAAYAVGMFIRYVMLFSYLQPCHPRLVTGSLHTEFKL